MPHVFPSIPAICVSLTLTLPCLLSCSQEGDRARRGAPEEVRHAVLLLFDDLRHDPFSFAGGPVHTPRIDELAAEGVVFTHAMTTTGLCSPARAALFTGKWGHRSGLEDNTGLWHSRETGLPPEEATLIEWAAEKGYQVGFFGKWHLGQSGPDRRGAARTSHLGIKGGPGHVHVPSGDREKIRRYYEQGPVKGEKPLYYKTLDGSYEQTGTAEKVRVAAGFIREIAGSGDPFLLTVSFNQPHPPYRVPEPFASMFDSDSLQLPASIRDDLSGKPLAQSQVLWPWHDVGHMTAADWKKARAFFYGAVAMIDRAVGELTDVLKETGVYGQTMVVVVGDQGSMIGEHGLYDKGPYCYDELMRIPLIIRVPGKAHREVDRQVSLLDLNRTLVEWMDPGKKTAEAGGLDSRSLFPLIDRGDGGWSGPDEAFYHYQWYNGSWFGIRTIRTPAWKYCWNPADLDELYDLASDPKEMTNLADQPAYRDSLLRLRESLAAHMMRTEDPLYKWFTAESEAGR